MHRCEKPSSLDGWASQIREYPLLLRIEDNIHLMSKVLNPFARATIRYGPRMDTRMV
jgi:hypothetical protein